MHELAAHSTGSGLGNVWMIAGVYSVLCKALGRCDVFDAAAPIFYPAAHNALPLFLSFILHILGIFFLHNDNEGETGTSSVDSEDRQKEKGR